MTDEILAKDGLKGDDINKVIIPQIPTRLEMLQNGKLAAATLPEPMASIAIYNGGRLLKSSDDLGINPGVISSRMQATRTSEEDPGDVPRLQPCRRLPQPVRRVGIH